MGDRRVECDRAPFRVNGKIAFRGAGRSTSSISRVNRVPANRSRPARMHRRCTTTVASSLLATDLSGRPSANSNSRVRATISLHVAGVIENG